MLDLFIYFWGGGSKLVIQTLQKKYNSSLKLVKLKLVENITPFYKKIAIYQNYFHEKVIFMLPFNARFSQH